MRRFTSAFVPLGGFLLVYLLPPIVVGLVYEWLWGSSGTSHDGLYIVAGVWIGFLIVRKYFPIAARFL